MIDAHVEFPEGDKSLAFLEDALEFSGVTGVTLVQRSLSPSINDACLRLTQESDGFVHGMISAARLNDLADLRLQLDTDSREPLLLGYNIDIHTKDAATWVQNEDIHLAAQLITERRKPLEILCLPSQVSKLITFFDAHPSTSIMIDHCLGNSAPDDQEWCRILREIGRRPHVYYRLSGLAPVASADSAYEATERVKRTFEAALNAFSTTHLIYGSGWPVTPARYPIWLNTIDNLIHQLSANERADICGCNAQKFYQLNP